MNNGKVVLTVMAMFDTREEANECAEVWKSSLNGSTPVEVLVIGDDQ